MMRTRRRKRIRLDLASYTVPGTVWHVTIGTLGRRPVLCESSVAEAVIESIGFQCAKAKSDLLMYCVMPEHLHLVIGIGDESDLISILHDFKSYTTTFWRKRTGQDKFWQESFYDHGVRHSERMEDLIEYVVKNPVEEGLVTDWREYPWLSGSLLEDT